MRHQSRTAQRVTSPMTYDLTATEETQLARELASDLDAYISN